MTDISRLDVHVDTAPHPGLMRSRIESALARRATDPGPEQAIGRAVADAVAAITGRTATAAGPAAQERRAGLMLMRGMLISFSDPNIGLVPTFVPFQYNPAEVTRTIKVNGSETPGGPGLRVQTTPTESYTLKLELDGVDAVDKPITGVMGVQPLLAAIEAMLEPAGSLGVLGAVGTALAGAVSSLTGASSGAIPAVSLPLIVLAWSAARIVPVRIETFTATETGFNAALLPVQATVDLSLTVLRNTDLTSDQKMANFIANAYQATRSALAITGVAQGVELML